MYFPFLPPNLLTCCCWWYSINVAITIVDVVVGFLFPFFLLFSTFRVSQGREHSVCHINIRTSWEFKQNCSRQNSLKKSQLKAKKKLSWQHCCDRAVTWQHLNCKQRCQLVKIPNGCLTYWNSMEISIIFTFSRHTVQCRCETDSRGSGRAAIIMENNMKNWSKQLQQQQQKQEERTARWPRHTSLRS